MTHSSWSYDARTLDGSLFWGAALFVALALVVGLSLVAVPNEDAAILFRYAVNLAETGRISFNPGGVPAEGATDFLFMIAIAGLVFLGLEPFLAALALNLAALLAILWLFDRMFDLSRPELALVGAVHLALPGAFAAFTGFSVFVFEAVLLLVLWQALKARPWGMALAILAACLTRPDAVVFCAALGIACLWQHRREARWWRAAIFGLVLPGAAHFLWRWSYHMDYSE